MAEDCCPAAGEPRTEGTVGKRTGVAAGLNLPIGEEAAPTDAIELTEGVSVMGLAIPESAKPAEGADDIGRGDAIFGGLIPENEESPAADPAAVGTFGKLTIGVTIFGAGDPTIGEPGSEEVPAEPGILGKVPGVEDPDNEKGGIGELVIDGDDGKLLIFLSSGEFF
jgi:hypothetical protein